MFGVSIFCGKICARKGPFCGSIAAKILGPPGVKQNAQFWRQSQGRVQDIAGPLLARFHPRPRPRASTTGRPPPSKYSTKDVRAGTGYRGSCLPQISPMPGGQPTNPPEKSGVRKGFAVCDLRPPSRPVRGPVFRHRPPTPERNKRRTVCMRPQASLCRTGHSNAQRDPLTAPPPKPPGGERFVYCVSEPRTAWETAEHGSNQPGPKHPGLQSQTPPVPHKNSCSLVSKTNSKAAGCVCGIAGSRWRGTRRALRSLRPWQAAAGCPLCE